MLFLKSKMTCRKLEEEKKALEAERERVYDSGLPSSADSQSPRPEQAYLCLKMILGCNNNSSIHIVFLIHHLFYCHLIKRFGVFSESYIFLYKCLE